MQNWFDATLPSHKICTFLWQICTACTNCCTQSPRAVLWWYICLTPSQSWLTSSKDQAWAGLAHSAFNEQQDHTSGNLCPATLKKECVLAICTWDQSILSSSTKAEPVERKPKMSHWWEQVKCLQFSAFFSPHTEQNHFPPQAQSVHMCLGHSNSQSI